MKVWKPTEEQVKSSKTAEEARLAATLCVKSTITPHPPTGVPHEPAINPAPIPMDISPESVAVTTPLLPTHLLPESTGSSKTISPPATLPENAKWYKSWKEFFQIHNQNNARLLETVDEVTKASWESLAQHATKLAQPGKKGVRVYIWEACKSGGFFRILQTQHEVGRDWEHYFKDALVFSPPHNTWDHCPFMWEPAIRDGPLDDLNDDGHIMEHWYTEPELLATIPDKNPSILDYLYQRYCHELKH